MIEIIFLLMVISLFLTIIDDGSPIVEEQLEEMHKIIAQEKKEEQ